MAEELIGALEGELNWEEFRDEYRDRVLEFVQAKAKGKKPPLHAVRAKRPTASLEDDLAKSLSSLKRMKPDKERKVA